MLFTLKIFQQLFLPRKLEPRLLASESIQDSTDTKSDTKLGIEHLKIASLPMIMLSGDILISYLWFVTERRNKNQILRTCNKWRHQVRRSPHYQLLLWSKGFPRSQPRSRPWQSQQQSWVQSRRKWRHCQWWHSRGICPLESAALSLKDWNKSTSTNNEKLESYRDLKSRWNIASCWYRLDFQVPDPGSQPSREQRQNHWRNSVWNIWIWRRYQESRSRGMYENQRLDQTLE